MGSSFLNNLLDSSLIHRFSTLSRALALVSTFNNLLLTWFRLVSTHLGSLLQYKCAQLIDILLTLFNNGSSYVAYLLLSKATVLINLVMARWCNSSLIITSELAQAIALSLNIRSLISHIVGCLDLSCYDKNKRSVVFYIKGRTFGGQMGKSISLVNDFYLSPGLNGRAIDLGCISLLSNIGILGVKVGITL
jgi:hypothetical protein